MSLLQELARQKKQDEGGNLQSLIKKGKDKTFTMPKFLGGGEFYKGNKTTERDVSQDLKTEMRGGSFQETDKEIDHIIPKSLGGTDTPRNLQAKESPLSFIQKIGSLFGREYSVFERPFEKRQGGKLFIEEGSKLGLGGETEGAIDKYRKGEKSMTEARAEVLTSRHQPKETKDFFWESLLEAPEDIIKNVSDWITQEKQPIEYLQVESEPEIEDISTEEDIPAEEEVELTIQEIEEMNDDNFTTKKVWERGKKLGKKEGDKVRNLIKEMAQYGARTVLAIDANLPSGYIRGEINDLLGFKKRHSSEGFLRGSYTPQSKLEKAIVGTGEKVSIESLGNEYAPIFGKKNFSTPVAIGIGLVDIGINVIPGGGKASKKAAKKIAKTTDVNLIKNELKTIFRGSDEILNNMAKTFSKEKNPKIISQTIDAFKAKKIANKKNLIKQAKQERKQFNKTINQESKNIAKTTDVDTISDKVKKIYPNLSKQDIVENSKILSKLKNQNKVKKKMKSLEIRESLARTGTFLSETGQANILPVSGQKQINIPDIDNQLKRLEDERFKITIGKGGKKGEDVVKRIDKKIRDLREQRNKILKDEGVAFYTNAKGKRVPAIRNKSGIVADKEWETTQFTKTEPGPTDNLLSWATTKDGIQYGEGAGTAWKFANDAYTKIADRNDFINFMSQKANKIFKDNKLLRGIFKTPAKKDLRIIYDIMDGKIVKGATKKHKKVAKELRKMLDEIHRQVNKTRQALGKEPLGYIDNYISHMERSNVLREVITSKKVNLSNNLDYIIPNEKYNPFVKKRIGDIKNKEKNIAKVLDKYFNSMADEIHISPLIEKTKAISKTLEGRGMIGDSNFLNKWVRTALAGKPSGLDTSLKLKQGTRLRKIVSRYNRARVLGALLGNLKWWLFTQPMSMANTIKETGLKNTGKGIMDWMTNPYLRKEINNLPGMRLKHTSGAGETMMGQLDKKVGKMYKSKIDSYNDIVGANIDFMEHHLTGASMAAGYRTAKQYGLKGKDASLLADYTGQVTQSMYNKEARPQMLQSLATKTAFPFQTFNTEMWRHAKTILGKGGGIPRNKNQRIKMLINLSIGTAMVNYINQKATGSNLTTPGSFIPLVGSLVDREVEKISDSVLGRLGVQEQESYQGPGRSIIAPVEDVKDLRKAFTNAIDHGNFSKMRELLIFWGTGGAGIAGGGQMNKMIDGLIAVEQGEAKRITGETMFEIDGVDEQIRSVIFGKYNTEAAKEYFNSKEEEDGLEAEEVELEAEGLEAEGLEAEGVKLKPQ